MTLSQQRVNNDNSYTYMLQWCIFRSFAHIHKDIMLLRCVFIHTHKVMLLQCNSLWFVYFASNRHFLSLPSGQRSQSDRKWTWWLYQWTLQNRIKITIDLLTTGRSQWLAENYRLTLKLTNWFKNLCWRSPQFALDLEHRWSVIFNDVLEHIVKNQRITWLQFTHIPK